VVVLEIHPFDKGRIQVANVYRNEVTPLRERIEIFGSGKKGIRAPREIYHRRSTFHILRRHRLQAMRSRLLKGHLALMGIS
jgi:hypothetical protein